jgi:dTDP-4-dehydrorhamnose 3,5-epimerase
MASGNPAPSDDADRRQTLIVRCHRMIAATDRKLRKALILRGPPRLASTLPFTRTPDRGRAVPIQTTGLEGLLVVHWETYSDDRGFFRQTYQTSELEEALGRPVVFRQGNHARSDPGVLRGFHAEPWDKLVYVAHGRAMAAIADIRPESPTFGQVETFELGDNGRARIRLFVSEGLANSYCTYGTEPVDYLYDVTAEYRPVDKRAIAWDDPDLAVEWPVEHPMVSDADGENPTLRQRFPDHPVFATGRRPDSTSIAAENS